MKITYETIRTAQRPYKIIRIRDEVGVLAEFHSPVRAKEFMINNVTEMVSDEIRTVARLISDDLDLCTFSAEVKHNWTINYQNPETGFSSVFR